MELEIIREIFQKEPDVIAVQVYSEHDTGRIRVIKTTLESASSDVRVDGADIFLRSVHCEGV